MAIGDALIQSLGGLRYKPEENPFGIAGQAIAQGAPYITNPYGSAGSNALYTIGAGLLAGLLGGVAKKQTEADNLALTGQWNEALRNPAARERIASENPRLATAINSLELEQMQRDAEAQQKLADQMQAAKIEVWKSQQMGPVEARRAGLIKSAELAAAKRALETQGDVSASEGPMASAASTQAPRDAEGSWIDMVNRAARGLIASGVATPATAMDVASKGLSPKLDLLKRQYARAEEADRSSREMLTLADQMESAFNDAGYTGYGGQLAHSLSGLAGFASADQQAKYSAGEALKSFGGKIIELVKPKGTGAMSDPEMMMWLKGGIDVTTPKETGKDIANRWRYAAIIDKNYADFIREQTSRGVSSSEIEKQWSKIVEANPYLIKDEKGGFTPNFAWQTGRLSLPDEASTTSGKIEAPRLGKESSQAIDRSQALKDLAGKFENTQQGREAFKRAAQSQGLI